MEGYFGKYVFIDLGKQEIKDYPIRNEWYEKFIGGRGIAARILLQELNPHTNAFSPDNILVFATGPFQGLGIPGSARFLVMGMSPKTKNINDSFCGGRFGEILGKSGYDGIIIKGNASSPVYISFIDGKIKILPADHLWGLDPKEVEDTIFKEYPKASIACIGKAGENKVIHASIMVDRNRAVGRAGYGAVMGVKKLKAIVIADNQMKKVANQDKLEILKRELAKRLAKNLKQFGIYGSPGAVEYHSINDRLPTKNFINGHFTYANKISGRALLESPYWLKRATCPNCPVACKRVVRGFQFNESFGPEWGGPEYETIAAFGSMLLIHDLGVICLCNKKCNQYGMDTISVGSQIAYLMEATERGLLKKDEQINWGDGAKVVSLIDKIAHCEGIGEYIAKGIDFIIQKVGDGSFLVHQKGEEAAFQDPRGRYSMALYYATSPRGGNHTEGTFDPNPAHSELCLPENPNRSWENRARIAGEYLKLRSFANSLIQCLYTADLTYGPNYNFPLFRDMIQAITGKIIGIPEMLIIGERNYDLLRIYAQKTGYRRSSDFLHHRFHETQPSSGDFIDKEKLKKTIDEYYKIYGYEIYGPGQKKQNNLG